MFRPGLSVFVLFAAGAAAFGVTASAGSVWLLGAALGAGAGQRDIGTKGAVRGGLLTEPAAIQATAPGEADKPEPDAGAERHVVTFETLAGFRYRESGAGPGDPIPAEVLALDGQTVTVRGFMVPMAIDGDGRVRSFLLTENQLLCCYGVMPGLSEWVAVDMAGERGATLHPDRPVEVRGVLSVGEAKDAAGTVSLYRLQAEAVTGVVGRGGVG